MLILQRKKGNYLTSATKLFTLDNPNPFGTSQGDLFGFRAKISGNNALVTARQEDDAGGNDSGKAYIFDVTTGNLVHTLDNPNPVGSSLSDQFGQGADIYGNYCIVSAHTEDDSNTNSGKAYIFDVTTGNLVHTLDNPNAFGTSANDLFGIHVAMHGNYAAIGAFQEDDAGGTNSGKVYVFEVSTGNLVHTLDNPNAFGTSEEDRFGNAVDINGTHVVVGAFQEDDAGGTNSGKVYVFNLSTGNLVHTLDNPNSTANDSFGQTVALNSKYVAVGSQSVSNGSGRVYLFDLTTGTLVHTFENPNPFGTSVDDNFSIDLKLTETQMIAAARREDEVGGTDSGKIYVFNLSTKELTLTIGNPNEFGTIDNDNFGIQFDIDNNILIVGVRNEDDAGGTDSGKVYIYQLS